MGLAQNSMTHCTRAVPRSYLDIEPYEDDGEGCSGDGSQGGETYLKNRSAFAAMPVNNFPSSSSPWKHPG